MQEVKNSEETDMWKCPKCGRSVKIENQQHFCGKAPETIDDYILAQDESIQDQLRNVREVLRDVLPNAAEKISWSMPTYWMGHMVPGNGESRLNRTSHDPVGARRSPDGVIRSRSAAS